MKYTQTITKPFQPNPLGKQMPTFVAMNLGVGKTAPFFVTSTLKGKKLCSYEQEVIPSNVDDDKRTEIEEINDPTSLDIDGDDRSSHTHYDTKSKKKKVVYHCSRDDDYIEVPGGSDTVPYTDEDGNQYEIPLDDLIEYDGEDGEIQYTKSKGKNVPLVAMHHIKDKPNYYLNMIMAQQMMQRVYGQA
jgi:hypothetical protein